MKHFLTLILLLAMTNLLIGQKEQNIQMPNQDSVQSWMEKFNVPAVAIGLIEKGKIKETIIYGELEAGKPAGKNAIFNVASLTKSITTVLTMKLVSAGKWDLDEPLHPYWVDPDVKDDPRHELLTSRHVLSHQTGFKNWRFMNEDQKLAFDFDPGTKTQYSGEGFEYLLKALENKFDTSFEELVQKWVFKKAKMKDSYLTWNEDIGMDRVAQWHNQEGGLYDFYKNKEASAADDLLTTIDDFTAFGVSVIQEKDLDKKAFQEMVTPTSEMKPKVEMGLGWVVFKDLPGGEYGLLTAGSDKGVNAISLLLPETQRGLVIMTNGDNGRRLVFQLMSQMLEAGQELMRRI